MEKHGLNIGTMQRGHSTGLVLALAAVACCSPVAAQVTAEQGQLATTQANAVAGAKAPTIVPISGAAATKAKSAAAENRSRDSGPTCSGEMQPATAVSLATGKSALLRLPETITKRTLGDPSVVEARLVAPQILYLLGVASGSTNMILQGKSGQCVMLDVVVGIDSAGLQAKLKELMPGETGIRVSAAAGSLVLSGVVSDSIKLQQAIELANAFVRASPMSGNKGSNQGTTPANSAGAASPSAGSGGAAGGSAARVINMLTVAAPQQVMLEVKVAEISKTLVDKLGAQFGNTFSNGYWKYSLLSNFLFGAGSTLSVTGKNAANVFKLDAENKDSFVKVLAEPSVMALSGQEGSFLAGGKIFIPVAQNNALSGGTITLEEREFGVGLRFTPTVLEGGRINLRVTPEVSEVNPEGIGISATTGLLTGTSVLPVITTRRATTTVQLMDGQSFAIGGLIKNNTTQNVKAIPALGQIPVLGALFRSTEFQNDRSELLFVVTPRLVKPLPANYKLPTDGFIEPSMSDLFLFGKMEGKPNREKTDSPATAAPPTGGKAVGGFEVK